MENEPSKHEGIENQLKRVFELARRVTGDDYRAIDVERDDDGWRMSIAGISKHGGTLHTTLFGLEQLLRERLKAKRSILREQLVQLGDDE